MKKVVFYLSTAIVVFTATIVYGLTVGGEIPIWVFAIELLILFSVFSLFEASLVKG